MTLVDVLDCDYVQEIKSARESLFCSLQGAVCVCVFVCVCVSGITEVSNNENSKLSDVAECLV